MSLCPFFWFTKLVFYMVLQNIITLFIGSFLFIGHEHPCCQRRSNNSFVCCRSQHLFEHCANKRALEGFLWSNIHMAIFFFFSHPKFWSPLLNPVMCNLSKLIFPETFQSYFMVKVSGFKE